MDRVKKLKIKKSNGSFTDYIPIGSDAMYVDLENGYSVEEVIGKIDPNIEGTIAKQLSEKANKNLLSFPNKNFNVKLGATINSGTASPSNWESRLTGPMLKYFDSIIFGLSITYDEVTRTLCIADTELETEISAFEKFIAVGGKCGGIKFHQDGTKLRACIDALGAEETFNQYATVVINLLNRLSFKNTFDKVWILNEVGNDIMIESNKDSIISLINKIKAVGYRCSCPYANAYAITDSNQEIVLAQDFLSLNLYPFNDIYKENTNIEQMAERFNKEFRIIERYLQNKELYITETGCSSSWKSFNNPPAYYQDRIGKPMSLWIAGLLKSDFMGWVKYIWLWYFFDMYTWNSDMLLNVKNNTEVQYGN